MSQQFDGNKINEEYLMKIYLELVKDVDHPYELFKSGAQAQLNRDRAVIEKLEAELDATTKVYQMNREWVEDAKEKIAELNNEIDFLQTIRDSQGSMIKKLHDDKAKLVECVKFYADKDNWLENSYDDDIIVAIDCEIIEPNSNTAVGGKLARKTLAEMGLG